MITTVSAATVTGALADQDHSQKSGVAEEDHSQRSGVAEGDHSRRSGVNEEDHSRRSGVAEENHSRRSGVAEEDNSRRSGVTELLKCPAYTSSDEHSIPVRSRFVSIGGEILKKKSLPVHSLANALATRPSFLSQDKPSLQHQLLIGCNNGRISHKSYVGTALKTVPCDHMQLRLQDVLHSFRPSGGNVFQSVFIFFPTDLDCKATSLFDYRMVIKNMRAATRLAT